MRQGVGGREGRGAGEGNVVGRAGRGSSSGVDCMISSGGVGIALTGERYVDSENGAVPLKLVLGP